MPRSALLYIHRAGAALALLLIAVFWSSTAIAWLLPGTAATTAVKQGIAYALPALVLAMAAAGGSGNRLAGPRRQAAAPVRVLMLARKRWRMPLIAANGLLVLVPAALWLHWRAQQGLFGPPFYAVQGIELGAGLANAVLMALNVRDGMRLRARTACPAPLA